MRSRGGAFALIAYLIYTIFGVVCTLLIYFGPLSHEDIGQLGLAALVFVILGGYTIAIVIGSIVLLVLKALHMGTRFALFGIPCLLADAYIIWVLFSAIISVGAINGTTFVLLPWLLLSVGSFVSNVRSF